MNQFPTNQNKLDVVTSDLESKISVKTTKRANQYVNPKNNPCVQKNDPPLPSTPTTEEKPALPYHKYLEMRLARREPLPEWKPTLPPRLNHTWSSSTKNGENEAEEDTKKTNSPVNISTHDGALLAESIPFSPITVFMTDDSGYHADVENDGEVDSVDDFLTDAFFGLDLSRDDDV